MKLKKGSILNCGYKILLVFCLMIVSGFSNLLSVKAAAVTDNFYYNIHKIDQTLATGTQLFLSDSNSLQDVNFQSISFPSTILSAQLLVAGSAASQDWQRSSVHQNVLTDAYNKGYSNGYAVSVVEKANGFDGCAYGWVFYSARDTKWHYYCYGSGVADLSYYGYGIYSGHVTANDVTIEANEPSSDTHTFTKNDVTVKVNVNGQTAVLKNDLFTLSDSTVDKTNTKTDNVAIKVTLNNGVAKEKVVSQFAKDAYQAYVDKEYLNNSDFMNNYYPAEQTKIRDMIAQIKEQVGNSVSQAHVDSLIATTLANQLNEVDNKGEADEKTANAFSDTYENLLNKQYVNDSDCTTINTAISEYNEMTDDAKKLLSSQYSTLQDMKVSADWDKKHGTIIDKTSKVTLLDLADIKAALNEYNAMSAGEKSHINPAVITDLENKLAAAKWITNYDAINKATTVNDGNVDTINNALTAYNQLTSAQKAYIDSNLKTALEDKLVVATWDKTHGTIIDKPAPMNDSDANAIKAAIDAYDKMSATQKGYVNADSINKLKSKDTVANWDKTHGAIIDKVGPINASDLAAIDSALNDYEALDNDQKAFVDKKSVDNLKAKQNAANWDKTNRTIIDKKDPVNDTDLTVINKALDEYNKLSAAEKALVSKDVIDDLKAKQNAANWDKIHGDIIDKSASINDEDIEAILKAAEDFDKLDDADKKYIDQDVLNGLMDKALVAAWDDTFGDIIDTKDPISDKDLSELEDVLTAYESMTDTQKIFVDQDVLNDLNNKLAAAIWSDNNKSLIYTDTVKASNLEALENALEEFENLSDEQKAYVDSSVIDNLNNKKAAAGYLDDNNTILNKQPISLSDKADIEKALDEYAKLSDEEKAAIDASVIDNLNAKLEAVDFLDKYKDILNKKQPTLEDLALINEALKAYGALSDDAKSFIDISVLQKLENDKRRLDYIKTGDTTSIDTYSILALLSLIVIGINYKKRKDFSLD